MEITGRGADAPRVQDIGAAVEGIGSKVTPQDTLTVFDSSRGVKLDGVPYPVFSDTRLENLVAPALAIPDLFRLARTIPVRVGRYGIRCPLVLERLAWDETSGHVIYRARPGRHDAGGESVARWAVSPALLGNVLEFLARVLDHLPEPNQQLLRYWGWYSNVARGRRERYQVEASAAPRTVTDPADAGAGSVGSPGRSGSARSTRSTHGSAPTAARRCASSRS